MTKESTSYNSKDRHCFPLHGIGVPDRGAQSPLLEAGGEVFVIDFASSLSLTHEDRERSFLLLLLFKVRRRLLSFILILFIFIQKFFFISIN